MSEIHTNRLKWAFYRGSKYNAAYVGATKIFPFPEPEPEYVITYTTTNGEALSKTIPGQISNTYVDGVGKYVFNEPITNIPREAFRGATTLLNITLPEMVETIDFAAFYGCTYLHTIVLPDTLKTIGEGVFNGCSRLSRLEIPSNVDTILASAFKNCTSLNDITLPNGITSLENQLFYGCTSLSEITIPSSLISIGVQVFQGCSALKSIIALPENAPVVVNNTFQGIASGGILTTPSGSDYSTWLGTNQYYLGYYGWTWEKPESDYDIIDNINNYTGTKDWVWATNDSKWYRRNNINQYEEYGIYADNIDPYEVITVTTYDNEFNTGAYYVSDHKAVGNTRIVVDFTTPDTFPSSTTMLIGGRTGATATYMTNIGYSKDGVLRVDAGSNTFQENTYTFSPNTRYIVDYRTHNTSLRYIVMDANGNVLANKTNTFSGSQRTNVNLGINTMMQPAAHIPFTQHTIIRSVKMYNIESVNDEGTLTDNYVFLGDGVCLNTITGYRAVISGGTATYTPSGSYEYAIGTTTYNGKLAIVNGVEYEFTNNQWTLVPSKDYDVCTAIFDGASYYDTGFLAGMPRRYTAIWKPDNTEDSIGVFGTYTEDNAQAVFMDGNTGEGAQNRYSFGKTTLNLGDPVDTSTELWEKIIISSAKPSNYSKQSGWGLSTGTTFNGSWTQISSGVSTSDFTNIDTHNSYIGALNKDDSMYLPFKGEFHSIQIQDSTNQSGNPWSMERDFVFIDNNGQVQAYDKVNNTLYSTLGSGVVTKGTTYDSISIQGKQYEERPAPITA